MHYCIDVDPYINISSSPSTSPSSPLSSSSSRAAATIRPHHTAMVKALKLSDQEVREQDKRFRDRVLEVLLSKDQVSQLMLLQREKVMTANTNTTTIRTPDLHHNNVSSNVLNSSNSNLLNSNVSSSMAQILEVHPSSSSSSTANNPTIIDPSSSSSFSEHGAEASHAPDTSSRK